MLTLKNTLKLSKMADKMQLEFSNIKDATPEEVGRDFINQIIRKAHLVSDEILEFVAEYKKISKEEAANVDFTELIEIIKNEPAILSFFK